MITVLSFMSVISIMTISTIEWDEPIDILLGVGIWIFLLFVVICASFGFNNAYN